MKSAQTISINTDAFYELLDQVLQRITEVHGLEKADRWVSADECMKILNIKSRTSLWELKSQGKIAYSQVSRKIVLYDRFSVLDYINQNRREAF